MADFELNPRDLINGNFAFRLLDKTDMRAEKHTFHLHPTSYGKNYFLVYGGKLRQFRVVRTYLNPWNYSFTNNEKRVRAIHELEISGIGKVFVAHNSGSGTNFPCKVYNSVEDYKNEKEAYLGYNADTLSEIQPFTFSLVFEHSYFSDNQFVPKMWKWDGTRAVAENATKAPMFYSFDGENIEIPNANDYTLPNGYYKTKEECENDNTFEVEYFDEEEETPKEVEVEITIASVTLKVGKDKLDDIVNYIRGLE